MGISNFPAALQPIIQQGYLQREIEESIEPVLGFRDVCERETFEMAIGETKTKTRHGLIPPVETYQNPATNTGLDNGLTSQNWTVEQYSMTLGMTGATQDLNVVTTGVGIVKQFMINAKTNAIQAKQSLDRLARAPLFDAYQGGNTRVTATLGAPATTIAVDDVRGFRQAFANGTFENVALTAGKQVQVGDNMYTLTGYTEDATTTSTQFRGVSGTLTFSTNVTVADATAGRPVLGSDRSFIVRAGGAATTAGMTPSSVLTMGTVLDAVARLRNNGIPGIFGGLYDCHLDYSSIRQLFADPDFKELMLGQGLSSDIFRTATIAAGLGVRFIPTTEAPIKFVPGVGNVHYPIIVGGGAMIEGDFAGIANQENAPEASVIPVFDSIAFPMREALDRYLQVIAMSWYWIGGFVVPSDVTLLLSIIPTAFPSRYKRGVVLEHVGA